MRRATSAPRPTTAGARREVTTYRGRQTRPTRGAVPRGSAPRRATAPRRRRRPEAASPWSSGEQSRALRRRPAFDLVLLVDHDVEMLTSDEARRLLLRVVGLPASVWEPPRHS